MANPTTKYGLYHISIGTTGWDAIADDNFDDIDTHINTRLLVTLGEAVNEGDAVCILVGGTGGLAKRGSSSDRKPAIGLAIEDGVLDDVIRVQRTGYLTSDAFYFAKIGRPVYLGDMVGSLTQTRPANDIQFIGVATATTTILLGGNLMLEDYVEPSTTTTTTSTSSTTTSSTSTTTTTTTTTTT